MRTHAILATLALALAACTGGGAEPDAPRDGEPAPTPGGEGAVQLAVETDDEIYAPGASMEVTLTLRNTGADAATLHFSSGQRFDIRVEDPSGESVWTWSATRSFIQALGSETIPAGETMTWTETAPAPTAPGEYTVVGVVPNREGPLTDRVSVTVR